MSAEETIHRPEPERDRRSPWLEESTTRFFPLSGETRTDVVVIGAGITGATTAYLLKQRGRRVVLLDAALVGQGETARSTAHLSYVLDRPLPELLTSFGHDATAVNVHAHAAAIDWIEAHVQTLGIECGFCRVPGYLFSEPGDVAGARLVEQTAEAAAALGLKVRPTRDLPLPIIVQRALMFPDQAQLNPVRYLRALLEAVDGGGARVYDRTRVLTVEDGEPCRVETEHGRIIADDVVVAAHVPITNRLLVHTKLQPRRTYGISARTSLPSNLGLYWDTARPYHYWRTAQIGDATYLLLGGADHHVGEGPAPADASFGALQRHLEERLGPHPIEHRWSGQIIEPADGLPYIGRNSMSTHVFVATGFAGNGLTGGTLAAMILTDDVLGSAHPWSDVFTATRVHPTAAGRAIVRENASFARHFVLDRLRALPARALSTIPPGEGRVVETPGGALAVYKRPTGQLSALHATCTHLGCLVAWNTAEKTWDCPCHGSRYAATGEVLNGPAVEPLRPRDLATEETEDERVLSPETVGVGA